MCACPPIYIKIGSSEIPHFLMFEVFVRLRQLQVIGSFIYVRHGWGGKKLISATFVVVS